MEIYLHVLSKFDCIFSACESEFELKSGLTTSFLLKTDENMVCLKFYPLNKQDGIPFCVHLNSMLQICEEDCPAMIVDFGKNNFLLVANAFEVARPTGFETASKIVNFGGQTHTVFYRKNDFFNIRVESNNKHVDVFLPQQIESISTRTSENNLFVFAKTACNKHAFAHIQFESEQYKIALATIVDLLETTSNSISVYQNLLDSCDEGKVLTFELSPKFETKSHIVFNTTKTLCKKKELIPFAFFDAVKSHNFALAREYLSPNLAQKMSPQTFEKFFGKFEFVFQSLQENNSNQIALVYKKTSKNFFATTFEIEFDQHGKIANIQEM